MTSSILRAAATISVSTFLVISAHADERRFTYSYEPEVLPAGGMEFEQWVTLRTQRTSGGEVKQSNFNLWELRQELEYGVSDNYSVSLYLNTAAESFRDYSQTPPTDRSHFDFQGISIENRYMVLNPAERMAQHGSRNWLLTGRGATSANTNPSTATRSL